MRRNSGLRNPTIRRCNNHHGMMPLLSRAQLPQSGTVNDQRGVTFKRKLAFAPQRCLLVRPQCAFSGCAREDPIWE